MASGLRFRAPSAASNAMESIRNTRSGKARDQIRVDDGDLSRVLDPPDDPGDAADIAVEHEDGLHVCLQTGLQPLVVADRGNDGVRLQGFIESLFQSDPPFFRESCFLSNI